MTTGNVSLFVFGGVTIVIDMFLPLGPPGIVRFSISAGSFLQGSRLKI